MKQRFKHYHDNGRLIATVATIDADENNVYVGVSRCRAVDAPSREMGRKIALERANILASGEANDIRVHTLNNKGLAMYISRENFLKAFIENNPFEKNKRKTYIDLLDKNLGWKNEEVDTAAEASAA